MELQVKNIMECYKWCLVSHTRRNMEDSGAECNLNCGGLDQEVSEENICMCHRNSSWDILATFCPYVKSLPEAKLKNCR